MFWRFIRKTHFPSSKISSLINGWQDPSGLVLRCRLWGRRVPGSNPGSTEDPPCLDLLKVKPYVVAKRSPAGVARKLGEGVPVQVSTASSDGGSK
ncbi:hypothetical protein AVEN_146050-1 [Araneus ventricosus]|uniref:Uncharacterized protein n=1 Tax=Araneus ventricosus TaxID=182803 RepID=A0A4Y2QVK2_ARAVE|nr:hypothetical protein AVEN_146050-1 [Araneus ventricosus]